MSFITANDRSGALIRKPIELQRENAPAAAGAPSKLNFHGGQSPHATRHETRAIHQVAEDQPVPARDLSDAGSPVESSWCAPELGA